LFIAEGDLVTERALAAGCTPVLVLCSDKGERRLSEFAPGYEAYSFRADDEVRRRVTGVGVPLDVLALFIRPEPPAWTDLADGFTRGILADNVDNPVNVGSIVRNAAAMGWDTLFLDDNGADPLARRSLRVAMGTAFGVRHARVPDVAEFLQSMHDRDVTTIALTPRPDATPLASVTLPAGQRRLVLLGSERHGLSDGILDTCTMRVRIEMHPGVDSLNVAAASAIACWALR
jgi:tRNA G18 (ribose-2'-O)-methylase SpoU